MTANTRILIVDDSRIFRGILQEALIGIAGVEVVGSVFSGARALDFLAQNPVDLVTLDLEMPQMSGLETLQAILQRNADRPTMPPVGILLVSAHTKQGAAITIEALEAGAFDFVTKPACGEAADNMAYLRQQLSVKIRAFHARRPGGPSRQVRCVAPRSVCTAPRGARPIEAVLIGVSTGGPAALAQLLPELTKRVPVPILIVQHMGAGEFLQSLAERLTRKCPRPVTLAVDGQVLELHSVVLAPDNHHLLVRAGEDGRIVTALNDQPPPPNGFRPSIDVLFRSAAMTFGAKAVGILLTGLRNEGTEGLGAMKRAGACTLAQDEASSVAWGMPGSAVEAGYVDRVLPLCQMAAAVQAIWERKA